MSTRVKGTFAFKILKKPCIFSATVEFCGRINGSMKLFADCAKRVDLEPYYTNCVLDMCGTGGDAQVLGNVSDE